MLSTSLDLTSAKNLRITGTGLTQPKISSVSGPVITGTGIADTSFDNLEICDTLTGDTPIIAPTGTHFVFTNCTIKAITRTYQAHLIWLKGGNLAFSNVTFAQADTALKPVGLIYATPALDNNKSTLSMVSCTATMPGAFSYNGVQNVGVLLISKCSFTMGGKALVLGLDAATSIPGVSNFLVSGSTFISGTGHGALIGAGCDTGTVVNCTISGFNEGIVVKEAKNITVDSCTVTLTGTQWNALYNKGSTGVKFVNNTVTANGGWAFREGPGDTETLPGNTTLTGNHLTALGTAQLFYWDMRSTGGAIEHDNILVPSATAPWGTIRNEPINSLADINNAWIASPFQDERANIEK